MHTISQPQTEQSSHDFDKNGLTTVLKSLYIYSHIQYSLFLVHTHIPIHTHIVLASIRQNWSSLFLSLDLLADHLGVFLLVAEDPLLLLLHLLQHFLHLLLLSLIKLPLVSPEQLQPTTNTSISNTYDTYCTCVCTYICASHTLREYVYEKEYTHNVGLLDN